MNPTTGVLSEAWGMYKAHWRHLLPIAFVVYALVAVLSGVLVAILEDWAAAVISAVITLMAAFWLQGALVKAVEDVRDGRADLSVADTFGRVWPRVGAIAIAGILAGIGIVLGLVALVVPGLVLMTWWILIVPAIVIENRSAGESFGRSRELVRGHGWQVFGVIVLTILVVIAAGIVVEIVVTPLDDWLQSVVGGIVSNTLTAPFVAVAWTLLYYRLRDVKERATAPAPEAA